MLVHVGQHDNELVQVGLLRRSLVAIGILGFQGVGAEVVLVRSETPQHARHVGDEGVGKGLQLFHQQQLHVLCERRAVDREHRSALESRSQARPDRVVPLGRLDVDADRQQEVERLAFERAEEQLRARLVVLVRLAVAQQRVIARVRVPRTVLAEPQDHDRGRQIWQRPCLALARRQDLPMQRLHLGHGRGPVRRAKLGHEGDERWHHVHQQLIVSIGRSERVEKQGQVLELAPSHLDQAGHDCRQRLVLSSEAGTLDGHELGEFGVLCRSEHRSTLHLLGQLAKCSPDVGHGEQTSCRKRPGALASAFCILQHQASSFLADDTGVDVLAVSVALVEVMVRLDGHETHQPQAFERVLSLLVEANDGAVKDRSLLRHRLSLGGEKQTGSVQLVEIQRIGQLDGPVLELVIDRVLLVIDRDLACSHPSA